MSIKLNNINIERNDNDISQENSINTINLNVENKLQVILFDCCICLDDFVYSNILELKCCHQYIHQSCLLKWIISKTNNETCPLCRENVQLDKLFTANDIIFELEKSNLYQDNIFHILKKWYNIKCIRVIEDDNSPFVQIDLETINSTNNTNENNSRHNEQNNSINNPVNNRNGNSITRLLNDYQTLNYMYCCSNPQIKEMIIAFGCFFIGMALFSLIVLSIYN